MTDVLARICADKRVDIARRKAARPEAEIERLAQGAPPPRGFARALRATAGAGRRALIAEIKRASPSRGLIRADFDPAVLARAYRDGGATCLSVLTDTPYFQGEDAHLAAARAAVDLPVLRKDFTLDPYQVSEARMLGADAVLLILAALDDAMAARLNRQALALGLDVLAEVHDRAELDRALALDGAMIGINNRDLRGLEVNLATFEALAPHVPRDRLLIAESGIRTPADIARLSDAGARGFLVGESLMAESDVGAATRRLLARAPQAVN
jgi:indole-3-glycerol phosphate synthase